MIPTAELHQRFLRCTGACTDTRQVVSGGMFFALKGPNFDANTMAGGALQGGCLYAVVDDPQVATDDRFILVNDVLSALEDLARHHRRTFGIPVIAITGSNGKTTTKELVHAVLGSYAPALATSGNLNNHIGVPLMVLGLRPGHRVAATERGQDAAPLDNEALEEIVFDVFPAKVSIDASEARWIVDALRAFFTFLDRVFALPAAPACLRVLGQGAVVRLEQALADTGNYVLAKSLAMEGKAAGFPSTPPKAWRHGCER